MANFRGAESVVAAAYGAAKIQLARDLHDRAGWHLTAFNYELLAVEDDPTDRCKVAALRGRLCVLSHALRALTAELRDEKPERIDLVDTVGCLLREWTQITQIPTEIGITTGRLATGCNCVAAVAAVLGELLTNVARHAPGSTCVRVAIGRLDLFGLTVDVSDDGAGIEAGPSFEAFGGHFGITGARERLQNVMGTLEIGRGSPCGTRATIRIPDARL